jgi:hypothetical protein
MLFPLHEGSCPCSELKEGKKKERKKRKEEYKRTEYRQDQDHMKAPI